MLLPGIDISQTPWHAHTISDVLSSFETSMRGLSEKQSKDRLEKFGLNKLQTKPPKSLFTIFLSQFLNPLIAILLVASIVSLVMQEWLDAGVIAFAIIINTILGCVEEYKADRSMEKLKSFLPLEARVRRDGREIIIDANKIVPGDIVILSTGDKITADGRIIHQLALEVRESALTGESSPIQKNNEKINVDTPLAEQKNRVFAGTVVVAGHGEYVVTSTGQYTELGRISSLVSRVEDRATPLQEQMKHFARWLGFAVLFLTMLLFLSGILTGISYSEMVRVSLAVAVSAIPEGLVVALTVILAIGMQRILKQNALVRRLVAAETLGSVSIICMDKTGTLTTGEMALVETYDGKGKLVGSIHKQQELAQALWNLKNVFVDLRNGKNFIGTPTEVALVKALANREDEYQKNSCEIISEIPFDSQFKYKAGICKISNKHKLYVVGAPEVLLTKLDESDTRIKELEKTTSQMASKGLRVLLVASSEVSSEKLSHSSIKDLKVLGIVGLRDPLRKTAKETIEKSRLAGLVPVMITGDHPQTAFHIAHEAGMINNESQILTGIELDGLSDEVFHDRLGSIFVYARVLPRHKLRIINAWQTKGFAVAMVGDGVNDAPAMKGADIGIALGSGTEVAKETADMVLLKDNFSTIVHAIEQGRAMFDNIRKMVVYLLSDSFSEIILIFGAILCGLPLPILPAQILWINLITDGFPSVALTFEKPEKGIMKESPRKRDEPILNKEMKILIFVIGIITDLALFAIYFYLLGQELNIDHIRTFIFIALGLDSLFYAFAVRTFRSSVFTTNPFSNPWLVAGIVVGFLLLLLPMLVPLLRDWFKLTPLTVVEWFVLIGLAIIELLLIEIVKFGFNGKGVGAVGREGA